jgi:hypothetical protein
MKNEQRTRGYFTALSMVFSILAGGFSSNATAIEIIQKITVYGTRTSNLSSADITRISMTPSLYDPSGISSGGGFDGVGGIYDIRCEGFNTTSAASDPARKAAANATVSAAYNRGIVQSSNTVLIIFADGGSEKYTVNNAATGDVSVVAGSLSKGNGVATASPFTCKKITATTF